ncbi:alpha/beta hydrolase [Aureisphaera galaxeae]|uniref:alpha/beta fold hydrolase n=1 Tax=Aureisphaera galaxeae TaxID=1538023 RepID=UPI00235098A6|nr:alpha/beta hydrolase [Aureisphaera galaxeae]MDC8005181.1 alpha/beta hydrolase [Aureisphaera galaxeae]
MNYSQFRQAQQKFTTADGDLAYIDNGEGEVILLLHGVPTSGWLYRHMIDSLSENHRVIVPDMLGFGNSDSPKGYEIYSEKKHAERILALMDALGIKNWTHVMHDAGGLWTWEMLRRAPESVSKLVILNTLIYEEGFSPPIRFEKGLLAKMAMWSYRNGITTGTMIKGLFNSGLVENNLTKEDEVGYKVPLKEGKTRAMYYFFTQTCNKLPDFSEVLKGLNIPVAVIWGKHDSFLLWERQKERVKKDLNIAETNIHLLEAKHFIQEENPDEIAQIISDFIS